jgi:hypothetical protein
MAELLSKDSLELKGALGEAERGVFAPPATEEAEAGAPARAVTGPASGRAGGEVGVGAVAATVPTRSC